MEGSGWSKLHHSRVEQKLSRFASGRPRIVSCPSRACVLPVGSEWHEPAGCFGEGSGPNRDTPVPCTSVPDAGPRFFTTYTGHLPQAGTRVVLVALECSGGAPPLARVATEACGTNCGPRIKGDGSGRTAHSADAALGAQLGIEL